MTDKPLAFFDLDGTLVREQLMHLLMKKCFEFGVFSRAAKQQFDELLHAYRNRRIAFEEWDGQVFTLFMDSIPGCRKIDFEAVAQKVALEHQGLQYVFTKAVLGRLAPTHERIAITGSFSEIVKILAPQWGFDHFYATELEVVDGLYTGARTKRPAVNKALVIAEHIAASAGHLEDSVGVGDTNIDIPLLESVAYPIAFNPSAALATEAEARGWPIVVERKDSIYVLLGRDRLYYRFPITEAEEAVISTIPIFDY